MLLLIGHGYRAMLFHLGALWRLNDFGLLPALSFIGGDSPLAASLTAGCDQLVFRDGVAADFERRIATPLIGLADQGPISINRLQQLRRAAGLWVRVQWRGLSYGGWHADTTTLWKGRILRARRIEKHTAFEQQGTEESKNNPRLDVAAIPFNLASRVHNDEGGPSGPSSSGWSFLISDAQAPALIHPPAESPANIVQWGMTLIPGSHLICPAEKIEGLAGLPDRYWPISRDDAESVVDWGYAACDAAVHNSSRKDLFGECRKNTADASPYGTFYAPTAFAAGA